MRILTRYLLLAFLFIHAGVRADEPSWHGEWITDLGVMRLSADEPSDENPENDASAKISGTFGVDGKLTGATSDLELTGEFNDANSKGAYTLKMADDGRSFTGSWRTGSRGRSGKWRGWRSAPPHDNSNEVIPPNDVATENTDFSGAWLTSRGLLQLNQEGTKVEGEYGVQGRGTIKGTISGAGQRLKFDWTYLRSSGRAWLEVTDNGKRLFGRDINDKPKSWTGLNVNDYQLNPKPVAGQVVQGRTNAGLLYFLRMPDDWTSNEEDETKPTDLIVLLHGSNWTTRGMVPVTAKNWPDLGRKFAILGIQGERWATWSETDDLRFNYSYVNWMGRSTYKGFPNTDRESPYLVAQTIDELTKQHGFDRVFVGGHSQGGYLTYLLHMHYPEKLAGTFPIAGGLVMQAEPSVFDNAELQNAQRATPMAIVHGTQDRVVNFSNAEYIERQFRAHDFPLVKLFRSRAGHPYDFLPIGDAVRWLDTLTTTNEEHLLEFAEQAMAAERYREVGGALLRASELSAETKFSNVRAAFETAANKDAAKYLELLEPSRKSSKGREWFGDFLTWHDNFSQAAAAEKTIAAYQSLQEQHAPKAKELRSTASKAFRAGDREQGWKNYQQIIDECFADPSYRDIKAAVDKRK